jgi:hypothetical protein
MHLDMDKTIGAIENITIIKAITNSFNPYWIDKIYFKGPNG